MTHQIGDKINSNHFGEGVILSFENDHKAVRVLFTTGEKLMSVFALTNRPVAKSGKSRGDKRRERDAKDRAAFAELSNAKKIESKIMWINGVVAGDRHSASYKIVSDLLGQIVDIAMEVGDKKIVDICNTTIQTMRASDRQAYILAKFADDNKISY